jgi:opacity protein-like surface antigen
MLFMKKLFLTNLLLFLLSSAFAGDFFIGSGYIIADEDNTDGDGVYAELGYMFSGKDNINHCIQIELGKLDMGYKEEAQYLEAINARYGTSYDDLPSYDTMPYLISYKCIFPLIDRVHGFAKFGGGLIRAEVLGQSDTSMAFETGLGVELMANDALGVHLEYNYVKMDDLSNSINGTEYTLSVGDISTLRVGCVCYF